MLATDVAGLLFGSGMNITLLVAGPLAALAIGAYRDAAVRSGPAADESSATGRKADGAAIK
ncbi:MAG: hypothetical protein ABIM89_02990 [Mycobacteriales bacterium]